MIRRPPRSTLLPLHDALPISRRAAAPAGVASQARVGGVGPLCRHIRADPVQNLNGEVGGGSGGWGGWRRLLRSEPTDRKSTRLNSSHLVISYAVFCLKKKRRR